MAINFPDSPSLNDTHSYGGNTWKWDGESWVSLGAITSSNPTATRDIFTGDGNTTTFTLSTTPSAESQTLIFVDAVIQSNAAYSLANNQIEFNTAPDSNTKIIAYTLADGPSGPSGPAGPTGPSGSGSGGVSLGLVIALT
jgi:hypothetical protein